MSTRPLALSSLTAAASLLAASGPARPASAQPAEGLAPYFGFREGRIVVADDGAGPAVAADFNGDGLPDLALVNNRKSRIELFYLRDQPRSDEELRRGYGVNELPPNPWYDHERVSVAHRVTALRAHDVDADGKPDIVYAGSNPAEIVVLRQESPSKFEMLTRTRVRDLAARQSGLEIADVVGDERPEVIAVADGKINVFPFDARGRLGEPATYGSGGVQQFYIEDYDGDGRADIAGIVPEDPAPLRLWLQAQDPAADRKAGILAAEMRFEMPALVTAEPLRFSGRAAASVAVLERASRRTVMYDLVSEPVAHETPEPGVLVEREVQAEVSAFADGASKSRSVVVADLDADGRVDLVTTDGKSNSVVLYRQREGVGLGRPEPFSAFKAPKAIDVGEWGGEGGGTPEVFVLSEEEKTVGVAAYDAAEGRLSFPTPLTFATAGATPIAMDHFLTADGRPALAVVLKDRREYTLEVHYPTGENGSTEVRTIVLKDVKRDPGTLLPFDADRDGVTDLLVLTPGEAMMMVRFASEGGAAPAPVEVLTKDQMQQFGLVQAAGPDNTALLDIDGDGHDELLIADANFVRAAAYDPESGWRVADQINTMDSSARLAGLALLPVHAPPGMAVKGAEPDIRIVAADRANGRLLIMDRNEAGRFTLRERVRLLGFPVGAVRAGSFTGDGRPGVLALGDDSFALVRLAGTRPSLEQFAAYRSEDDDRIPHAIEAGDVNGDGYLDLVLLDAAEQMCEILTFSASRKLHHATEFKVFESRLFSSGDSREYQPSGALVTDLTGDGAADLGLLVHDRVLIYPQMAAE